MSLIDQQARTEAIDPAESFIVQAPAGSGKTGLLVRRILALLQVVEKPEEILAITFTRKATAEMRERVIDALKTAATGSPFKPHEQDMAKLAHAALHRDTLKQWHLLHQPQRLKIQTIDALCAELVRKMPWSTRFGGMPQIETEPDRLYAHAAQNLLQRIDSKSLYEQLRTLLMFANGDLATLKAQLAGMLYQREAWLILLFAEDTLASRERVEQHWIKSAQHTIDTLELILGSGLWIELRELAQYAAQHWPENKPPVEEDVLLALHDKQRIPSLHNKILRWGFIGKLLLTAKNGFLKSVSKTQGFPLKDDYKSRMLNILDTLQDDAQALLAFQQLSAHPSPEISDDEWARLDALNTVLPALTQELYVLMSERNCADYNELAQRAIDALGDTDQPTDLALVQDYRLKHILMDEFQDTSPAQLSLLERLTAGWSSDDHGRSLFLVGDPMQSIYGFRGADVRVFLKVRDRGINDIRPRALELKVNFRSSPDIINWVNRTMLPVFPLHDQPDLARVKYSESVPNQVFPGAVRVHLCITQYDQLAADYRYDEAQQMVKQIASIQQTCPGDSIAILARKRAPLATLAECLREAGLEFEAVDLETPIEQSVVQDLICLCGILLQPMDTLAWLAVLRAPWCGLSLHDLTVLRDLDAPLIDILQQADLPDSLSAPGTISLDRVRGSLVPLVKARSRIKLTHRLRRAWLALRGPACYSAHELDHVEPFFAMLDQLASDTDDLSRIRLKQACRQSKSASPANSLKLMTIHKAKGLEFDHVMLTGLAGKSGGDNRQQALLQHAVIGGIPLVAPLSRTNEEAPGKAAYIRQHLKSIEEQEAARLLYVAVTRAKKQLWLYATLKLNSKDQLGMPQKGSLLQLLWPELRAEFELPQNQSEVSTENTLAEETPEMPGSIPLASLPTALPPLDLPQSIQFSPEDQPPGPKQLEFSWAQEDARIIGLVVHHLLESADQHRFEQWLNHPDPDVIEARLIQFGLIPDRVADAGQRVVHILQTLADDAQARWIFDRTHQDIKCEWALSCHQEGRIENFVIDRSFIDKQGVRWIIDFKTSTHEGGNLQHFLEQEGQRYAPQLRQYAALLAQLEPQREIRIGLYFVAIPQWTEYK